MRVEARVSNHHIPCEACLSSQLSAGGDVA